MSSCSRRNNRRRGKEKVKGGIVGKGGNLRGGIMGGARKYKWVDVNDVINVLVGYETFFLYARCDYLC